MTTPTNTQDTPDKRVEEWKNELRNITDPSGMTFIDKFGQNEVIAIERFIEDTLTQHHQDLMREVVERWRGKIICGFAGIGKSMLAKKYANVVDLESTPFEKDWSRYAKVARHMANNGYTVLLSCHREIREELHDGYWLAIPRVADRIEYIQRYKDRGNDEAFVTMMNQNWENFLERLPWESEYISIKNNLEDALTEARTIISNLT